MSEEATATAEDTSTANTDTGTTLFAEGGSQPGGDTTTPEPEAPEWAQQAFGDAAGESAKMLSNFDDPGKFLQSYKDNMAAARAKAEGVTVPGEGASDEQVAKFREAMGVPEDAAGYGIERPDEITEGQWDAEAVEGFTELAHELGIPKDAAQKIVGYQVGLQQQAIEGHQAFLAEQREVLDKAWGEEAGARQADMGKVLEFAREKLGLDINPQVDQAFADAKIPILLGELGKQFFGEQGSVKGTYSSGYANPKDEYRAMQDPDSGHRYAKVLHRGHGPDYAEAQAYALQVAAKVAEMEEQAAKA